MNPVADSEENEKLDISRPHPGLDLWFVILICVAAGIMAAHFIFQGAYTNTMMDMGLIPLHFFADLLGAVVGFRFGCWLTAPDCVSS